MAQRHKRQTRVESKKKAQTSSSEGSRQKESATEPINQEHREIMKWFQSVKFRRVFFGGVDENDVWRKLEKLNQHYEAAIRAERERYNILLEDHEKTYGALIYKYKQEMLKNDGTLEGHEEIDRQEEEPSEVRNEVRR